MAGALAACHEYDIALARIGIVVLQEEELIDTIFLQRRYLDHDANWARQASLDDEILLSANLREGAQGYSSVAKAGGRALSVRDGCWKLTASRR